MSISENATSRLDPDSNLRATIGHHERYPGPRYFEDNELDRRLFFGREQEIDDLLHRIRASSMLVIFGKSGLGKTSLLKAGLFPRLREHGLLPVSIRLDRTDIGPIEAVFASLRATCEEQEVDYNHHETEGLWEFFKTTDLWRGDTLQIPVLVFDQFEEIFNLQSESVRVTLTSQLGELIARGLPDRIRKKPQSADHTRYTDTPPEVKIILSLREEYVGALEQLVPNVPGIFEQRFRLTPLDTKAARRAVVEPALLDLPEAFVTQPFRYEESTLGAILKILANRQREVEPFQLQIICQHSEQQVLRRQREGSKDVVVDDKLLDGVKNIEKLLENFYRRCIREISFRQRSRARRLCELGLLTSDGYRESMAHGKILKDYGISENTLKVLVDTKLMRKELRAGLEGFYYELSHDSVAGAVQRSRRFRVPTVFKTVFAVMLLLAIGISFYAKEQRQIALLAVRQAESEERVAIAAKKLVMLQDELAMRLAQLNEAQNKAAASGNQEPDSQRKTAQAEKQVADAKRRTEDAAKQLAVVEQQAKKAARDIPQTIVKELPKRAGLLEPEMIRIPAGTFQMGDIQGRGGPTERPVRTVRIQKPFAIGRFEVTFDEYDQFAAATKRTLLNDRGWGRGRRPVIDVSWHDAVNYAKWLSAQTGRRYRLPTEAEWEYAARGGNEAAYWWGNDFVKDMANCFDCSSQEIKKQTTPIGSFSKPNGFGLYDTTGNVYEWVEDCWHVNYQNDPPVDGSAWRLSGDEGCQRVLRGGSWYDLPGDLRSSFRFRLPADYRNTSIGFRLAQDLN